MLKISLNQIRAENFILITRQVKIRCNFFDRKDFKDIRKYYKLYICSYDIMYDPLPDIGIHIQPLMVL